MNSLDVSNENMEKLSRAESKALDITLDVLEGKREVDDVSKTAMKTLSVVAKNRQTLTNRQAIGFSMASAIATPGQLKKYIAVTAPKVQRALSGQSKAENLR